MAVVAEDRPQKFAEAVDHVHAWATPELALDAAGIDPQSLDAAEWEIVEEAERDAIDAALRRVRQAAESGDRAAAKWLRRRGLE